MSLVLLALHSDEGRLAAILAADIAGYSRLMGQDETQALRDLEGHEDIVLLVTQTCCLDHRARCARSNAPLHPEGHGRAQLHAPKARRKLYHIDFSDIVHDGAHNRISK
jgi:hypothetical protein